MLHIHGKRFRSRHVNDNALQKLFDICAHDYHLRASNLKRKLSVALHTRVMMLQNSCREKSSVAGDVLSLIGVSEGIEQWNDFCRPFAQ